MSKVQYYVCYYLGRNLELLFIIGASLLFHNLIYPSLIESFSTTYSIDFGNSTEIEQYFARNIGTLSQNDVRIQIVSGWISQHLLPPINIENLQYIALLFFFNDCRMFFMIMPQEYLINIGAAVILGQWTSLGLQFAVVSMSAMVWLYLNRLCLYLRHKIEKQIEANHRRIHEPCLLMNEILYEMSQANQIDLLRIREEMLVSQELDLIVADYIVSSIYLVQIGIFRQVPFLPSWMLNFHHAQTNNIVSFPSTFQYALISGLSSLPSVYYWQEHIRLVEYSSWSREQPEFFKECVDFRNRNNYIVLTYNALFFMLFLFKSLINSVRHIDRQPVRIN